MKVQTCDHTWDEESTRTEHIVLGCHATTMPLHAFVMARMTFGAHTSKTRETTKIAVSGSSRCTWNCIFTHSEAHPGLVPCSKHESLCTSLRKYVDTTHSDSTPGCPDPLTTHSSRFSTRAQTDTRHIKISHISTLSPKKGLPLSLAL
jgi:hypothetical protein